jgi:hypothetical protein
MPVMTAPTRTGPVPAPPTHRCVRCGVQVPLDVALCERCNPLGLPQPASSQAHGTVAAGIVLAVIALAVLGRVALSGVGPFAGSIAAVVADPPNLGVTLTVVNEGSREGAATCRIFDPATGAGIGPESAYVTSPQIAPGQALTFSRLITSLGSAIRPLAVECRSP